MLIIECGGIWWGGEVVVVVVVAAGIVREERREGEGCALGKRREGVSRWGMRKEMKRMKYQKGAAKYGTGKGKGNESAAEWWTRQNRREPLARRNDAV